MEQFADWKKRHEEELANVGKLLEIPLSDEPETLWQMLRTIEAYYGRLQYCVSVSDAYLDIATAERIPRGKSLTVDEKKAQTDALCSEERSLRDVIQGYIDSIKQRIMLGQTRLNYCRDMYVNAPVKHRE
jgi:hypothetical protein